MLLPDLVENAAERFPEKPAVEFRDESLSFGELQHQSSKVAQRLKRLGIGSGDRVAILHENAIPAVTLFWGVLKSGAQSVDIPYSASDSTVREILAECHPRALVISEGQISRLRTLQESFPDIVLYSGTSCSSLLPSRELHFLCDIVADEAPVYERPRGHDCDAAMIVYTSGSTGAPKGVMLSHRNLLSNIRAANSLMKLTDDDSILVVVPLHFIHGRMQLLLHAMLGGTVAFSAGFQFPQQVVSDLQRFEVSGFSGVPYHFTTLLERTSIRAAYLPRLRYVLVTGGALQAERMKQLADALPSVSVHTAYGQTEASPRVSYLGPSEIGLHSTSNGRALPGVKIEIVDDSGDTVAPNEFGEVVVSGPNIMLGYVSGDESSEQGKIDEFGRLHTGDLGTMDAEGFLYVAGRKSEMIKCAGERIFPREIERVLDEHPSISDCAVIGVPDDVFGERIVAFVVIEPRELLSPEELRTYCLNWLPLVRVPREFIFQSSIPKTSSGKVDRAKLFAGYSVKAEKRAA